MKRWADGGLMCGQRRRGWNNIKNHWFNVSFLRRTTRFLPEEGRDICTAYSRYCPRKNPRGFYFELLRNYVYTSEQKSLFTWPPSYGPTIKMSTHLKLCVGFAHTTHNPKFVKITHAELSAWVIFIGLKLSIQFCNCQIGYTFHLQNSPFRLSLRMS